MSMCAGLRRFRNAVKQGAVVKNRPAPRRADPHAQELKVYVVTQAYAKERGWGGNGAMRFGPEDGVDPATIVFKLNDTWPARYAINGARFYTVDILAEARRLKAGNGAPMEDILIHEGGGHQALGWQHYEGPGADNAVMNDKIRGSRKPLDYERDRSVLRKAFTQTHPVVQVILGWHP